MSNNSIKANELRIGNYVFDNLGGTLKIKAVSTESDLPHIKGIPLTDEWFKKWGFYKDGEYWSKGIFDYKYCFKYRGWANNWAFYQEYTDSPNSKDDGIKYPISFDIEYVHQLQNLWFALLYEEIEP
jgi:hypothetical protein